MIEPDRNNSRYTTQLCFTLVVLTHSSGQTNIKFRFHYKFPFQFSLSNLYSDLDRSERALSLRLTIVHKAEIRNTKFEYAKQSPLLVTMQVTEANLLPSRQVSLCGRESYLFLRRRWQEKYNNIKIYHYSLYLAPHLPFQLNQSRKRIPVIQILIVNNMYWVGN